MENIEIWNEKNNKIPVVVSIPHSGTYIPKVMKEKLKDNIVLANIDWYLPELYSFLKDIGFTTIIDNISRYVIDPNREILDNYNDSYTKSYIYTKTTFGSEMYKKSINKEEIEYRIDEYYKPFHKAIERAIKDKLDRFDKVYLLDLHSFGKELDENIVLGNRNGETSSEQFTNLIKTTLENCGFRISINHPYSGGFITRKYAKENIETIQIELSYKTYIENRVFLNEEFPNINLSLFNETKQKMRKFFNEIKIKITSEL